MFPETFGKHRRADRERRAGARARQVRARRGDRRGSVRRRRSLPLDGAAGAAAREVCASGCSAAARVTTLRGAVGVLSRHRGDRPRVVRNGAARRRAGTCASAPTVDVVRSGCGPSRAARRATSSSSCGAVGRRSTLTVTTIRHAMADLLEFEEPIGVLLKEIEALSHAAATPTSASARSHALRAARRRDPRRALREPDAVAARAGRAPSRPARHARLRRAAVHRLRRDARRPALRRRPRDRRPASRVYHGAAGAGRRPPEGQRHQAEDLPQLRLRAAGGLPQGAARDAAGARSSAGRSSCFVDTPAAYPGHRVGGARRRRGDRREPARDDDARRADHRDRARRRRQRRRARHRRRRPHADARVRDLQRDPAGGLRGDPVARRRRKKVEAADGAEDHRAGPARARHHRRDRARAGRRRAHRSRRRPRALLDVGARRGRSPRCRRSTSTTRLEQRYAEVPRAWAGRASIRRRRTDGRRADAACAAHLEARCRATTRARDRAGARARRVAGRRAAAGHSRPRRPRRGARAS